MQKIVSALVLASLAGCGAAASDLPLISSPGTAPAAASDIWSTATPLERFRAVAEPQQ